MFNSKKEICKKSKFIHKSRVFDVYEDQVILPNGKPGRRGWIKHNTSVAIVPLNTKNEILLIKQYRYPTKKFLLEIPAGNKDKGPESITQCVQRELSEETGYKARKLVKLFEGYSLPGYCTEYMYYYLALDLYPEKLQHDDDEFIELIPTPLKKALAMIKNKKIIDSKTALGIYLAAEFLKLKKN